MLFVINYFKIFFLCQTLRFATFPWMYLLAGIFKDVEKAFITYVCINLFISTNTIITTSILYFLGQISIHNSEVTRMLHISTQSTTLSSKTRSFKLSFFFSFILTDHPGDPEKAEQRIPHLPPVQLWERTDAAGQVEHRDPDSQWLRN